MSSQNSVSVLIGQNLNKSIRVVVGLCTRVGHEREFANLVFNALALQGLLGLADPRNFGMSVHNAGHAVVVDVYMSAQNAFHANDALILGFVGQHRSMDAITDGVYAAGKYMK